MQKNIKFFIFIITCSVAGQLAAEVIAPSLPFIEKAYGVTQSLSSLTISYFMFGMALPLIIFGILADKYNRKKILLVSAYIGLLGSIGCTISPNIYILIISRFIQGIGLSGMSGIAMVLLRDRFSGLEFAKFMSYLGVAFSLSIDLAPFIGGFLQNIFSFRVIFAMVLLINVFAIYLAHAYKDHYVSKNDRIDVRFILIKSTAIITNRYLLIFTLLSSIQYAIFMVYIILGTFIIQDIFVRSPIFYGTTTICLSLLFAIFSLINGKLLNRININTLIITGLVLNLLSGIFILLTHYIFPANIFYFIIAVVPIFIGSAFVFANVSSLTFKDITQNIGLASTISSTLRFCLGFGITWIVGLISSINEIVILGISFFVLALIGIGLIIKNRVTIYQY